MYVLHEERSPLILHHSPRYHFTRWWVGHRLGLLQSPSWEVQGGHWTSALRSPLTGTVKPLAGDCPLWDQSNGVWRKQRLLYTTFWFDSGTKQDTSLWRSKKSSNSSSLMMNRSASLRASSPEFSPSIRRHWKTWNTSVVFALQGDFHHFFTPNLISPRPELHLLTNETPWTKEHSRKAELSEEMRPLPGMQGVQTFLKYKA